MPVWETRPEEVLYPRSAGEVNVRRGTACRACASANDGGHGTPCPYGVGVGNVRRFR